MFPKRSSESLCLLISEEHTCLEVQLGISVGLLTTSKLTSSCPFELMSLERGVPLWPLAVAAGCSPPRQRPSPTREWDQLSLTVLGMAVTSSSASIAKGANMAFRAKCTRVLACHHTLTTCGTSRQEISVATDSKHTFTMIRGCAQQFSVHTCHL
jgi:hypothetical protein